MVGGETEALNRLKSFAADSPREEEGITVCLVHTSFA